VLKGIAIYRVEGGKVMDRWVERVDVERTRFTRTDA
jgi:hypothetical protein